jgi:hypothetical protein
MNERDIALENNAMLKVLLRNQVQIIAVLDEAVSVLNGNPELDEEKRQLRAALVEARMALMEAEVNMIKLKMQADEVGGKR